MFDKKWAKSFQHFISVLTISCTAHRASRTAPTLSDQLFGFSAIKAHLASKRVPRFTLKVLMPEAQIKERGRRRWRGKKRAMYSQYCSSMPHTPWESRRWKQLSEIKLPLCYNAALSCLHWQISFLIPCRTERHSQQTPNYRHTLLSGVQFLTQRDYKRISLSNFFFQWNFLVRINKKKIQH